MAWAEKLPSGKWRGCWRDPDDRKRYTRRPDFPEHPYARKRDAVDAAQEAEVKARRQAAASRGTIAATTTWSEWWDLLDLQYPNSDTDQVVASIVRRYVRPHWGDRALNTISQKDVKAWVADLSPGREPNYVRRIYGVFLRSITLAMDREVLHASPCVGVSLPTARRRSKTYSDEAYLETIGPWLPRHYQDLIAVGLDTGLRPGELCGMHADQLDLHGGWVEVSTVLVSRKRLIRHYPKDADSRTVPLTDRAVATITRLLDGRDLASPCGVEHIKMQCRSSLVFLNARQSLTTPRAWLMALYSASEKAGVPARSPYAVRRGFATRAARGGMDAFELAAIMGHSDIRQTQEYVQQTPAARDRLRVALGDGPRLSVVRDAAS